MADNHNRGSSDAFRRRQEARRRREPQTIDAKAQDVTTSPLADPAEPGPQQSDPVSEAPAAVAQSADSHEPTGGDAPPAGADEPILSAREPSAAADRSAGLEADRAAAGAFPGVVSDAAAPAEPPGVIVQPGGSTDLGPGSGRTTSEPLPWLEADRGASNPNTPADETRAADPLASGEPVPVSEFVRTPGEISATGADDSSDRLGEVAPPAPSDKSALASGEPVPVSEFVRTPGEIPAATADESSDRLGEAAPPSKADALTAQSGLASGEPVPVSEFVRTPGEISATSPGEGGERLTEAVPPAHDDAPPAQFGSTPAEPVDVIRTPSGADGEPLSREPGHAPDDTSFPPASLSEVGAGVGSGPRSSDPAQSRDRGERFGDATPAFTPPAAARRTSFVPAGLAALALLVLAGLAGVYYGRKLGGSDELAAKVDALTQRVASLEARPVPPASSVDLGALDTRSTALDGDVAALKASLADLTAKLEQTTRAATENSGRIATLEQHAASAPAAAPPVTADNTPPPAAAEPSPPPTESNSASAAPAVPPPAVPAPATTPTIASPPATPGSGEAGTAPVAAPPAAGEPSETNAQLAALTGKVEDLAKRLAALPTEAPAPVDLAPLQGRISDLAARLEAEQAAVAALPKVDQAGLDTRLTGLDQKVDDAGRRVADVAQAVAAIPKLDLAPLQASIAEVDARLKPVEAVLAAPKSGEQVTEARAVGSTEESRAAPLAVVAGAIARALNEGRPFAPELDALHGLGIEDAALGPLPVLAGPGAPTAETLRDRWADIQTKVLTAAGPKTGDSVLDRFAAGARSLVQVRQVGAAPGDDPSAASARIGAALDRGDIADALGEWAKLPETSRTASQGWADAARSRLEADASVQALMVRAIAALAPPKN